MKTARGGLYVPSLFFFTTSPHWKLTAVLMPMLASTAAMTVVGICRQGLLSKLARIRLKSQGLFAQMNCTASWLQVKRRACSSP